MTFSDAVSELMANARNPYKMGNASLQVPTASRGSFAR
jgi:hypothetical protein